MTSRPQNDHSEPRQTANDQGRPLLAEYVAHLSECGGLGRGDEHCTCGAVAALAEVETAYALLWATQTSDKRVHRARGLLMALIGRDGQRRSIPALPDWARPAGPTAEMLFRREDEDPETYAAMVRMARRENDALLLADDLARALSFLLVIAGTPITDRQSAVFADVRGTLARYRAALGNTASVGSACEEPPGTSVKDDVRNTLKTPTREKP